MATLLADIPSLSDEQIEKFARFRLKASFFQALLFDDPNPEFYEVVKSSEKLSILMFPMIAKVIKTGSRADKVYLHNSDIDYMYEICPIVVNSKPFTKPLTIDSGDESLYLYSTDNTGFYTICDKNEGYIYPRVMQPKLAPIIRDVKGIAKLEESSPDLSLNERNVVDRLEDTVIAFKCKEWPKDIWEDFSARNPKYIGNMTDLKGKYFWIYFYHR